MKVRQTSSWHDQKVDAKVVLSGLWISMLFVFAYVDILGFWRADVINGALDGRIPGAGVDITQSFLTLSTLYILLPALMVPFSLMAPARINRAINLVASVLYAASVVAAAIGETWAYYIIGSVAEVLLLLAIAAVAWFWPVASTLRADPTAAVRLTGPEALASGDVSGGLQLRSRGRSRGGRSVRS